MVNTDDALTIASATTLFIPAVTSVFTQPFYIALLLFIASLASLNYHIQDEKEGMLEDVFYAQLTFLVIFILLTAHAYHYPLYSWRVWAPFVTGLTAVILFYVAGNAEEGVKPIDSSKGYHPYHWIWHILSSAAVLLAVVTRLDNAVWHQKYTEIFEKIRHNWNNPVHEKYSGYSFHTK